MSAQVIRWQRSNHLHGSDVPSTNPSRSDDPGAGTPPSRGLGQKALVSGRFGADLHIYEDRSKIVPDGVY